MGSKKIYIFALAAHGEGISGGDRIFIEFARHWSDVYPVEIFVWEEGFRMCQRQGLKVSSISYLVSSMLPWKNFGFVVNYFARIIISIRIGLTLKLENSPKTIIYSASEFWMDSLPAFLLKLRYRDINWVAAWYQTAPNPLRGFAEGGSESRYRLRASFYWLSQLPIKPLINNFANFVLVNNDNEKEEFNRLNKRGRAVVVLGAIDLKGIGRWKKKNTVKRKKYDAVFQGRFHPQKGVLELIDIWKLVQNQKSDAKLVMIGNGPLMESVKLKVQSAKLENNIILTGYLFDGPKKYKIFAQSKVVVHPAFYDSGGMAAAEAMAFGLPCVGFNLNSYKYYYPKGMTKVKTGDLVGFADKIVELLSNEKLYKKISKEVTELINYKWSWEYRSREILDQVLE